MQTAAPLQHSPLQHLHPYSVMLQHSCCATPGCAQSCHPLENFQTTTNPHYQLSTKAILINASWCCYTSAMSCFPPEPPQEVLQPATLSSPLSGINFWAHVVFWHLLKALESATEPDRSPWSPSRLHCNPPTSCLTLPGKEIYLSHDYNIKTTQTH